MILDAPVGHLEQEMPQQRKSPLDNFGLSLLFSVHKSIHCSHLLSRSIDLIRRGMRPREYSRHHL